MIFAKKVFDDDAKKDKIVPSERKKKSKEEMRKSSHGIAVNSNNDSLVAPLKGELKEKQMDTIEGKHT